MKKKVLFAAAFMLATVGAYAQGNGIAGITEATNMVTSYFDPGTKLIYAVGAVVGLIGGVKVYSKFSSGDPDTSKTDYGSHCVNQLGTGVKIRCYHVGSLSDTCDTVTLCVSTYCCKHKCCCE